MVVPFVAAAMFALFGVAALATDVGHVWAARSELQAAADAAAMAAAVNMVNPTNTAVTLAAAQTAANALGTANRADQRAVGIPPGNLSFGTWNFAQARLDAPVDPSDPNAFTGVTVAANLAPGENGPVQAVLAAVIGRTSFSIGAQATAYLGFAGSFPRDAVEVPFGIDCCAITQPNSSCGLAGGSGSFDCRAITSPPVSPCTLADGVTRVSCLDFEPPNPNTCWTQFDPANSSVGVRGLIDLIHDGARFDVTHEQPAFLDHGEKFGVHDEIEDKFLGQGFFSGNPHGVDRHPGAIPPPGQPDSWVVTIPVLDCQTQTRCLNGTAGRVVGGVCFEIREIDASNNRIKGNFVCDPSHPLYGQCQVAGAGPGGGNFGGVRATRARLVR